MQLLTRTIRSYFFYSFIILLLAIPLFYFIINRMVADDVDKELIAQKEAIVHRLDRATPFDLFDLLNALEPDINLTPSPNIHLFDTLYTARVYNPVTKQTTRYRFLNSNVIIRGQYYVIQLKNSLVNHDDLIQSIVLVQAILLVLIGMGLVLINRRLSKEIWNPFYATLQKLHNYRMEQQGKLHFAQNNITEFNDLNHTIEQLTERNYAVYQSQKEFTENASHEMQTPLAVLQTKLELLMQTQPLTAEQAALITTLADTNARLARLNNSLLLLTKIENNQYGDLKNIDVTEVCQKIIDQVGYQAEIKNITIQTNIQQAIPVKANQTLIEILISNLLTNAIRYNVEGGSITVTAVDNSICIQNTSAAAQLDPNKIFERFHKEGSDGRSIGLGLAIVKRICALYQFDIQYSYADGWHSFRIQF